MDVHADYAQDFVQKCVAELERTGADNVGGAARPRAKTFFQRCVVGGPSQPARHRRLEVSQVRARRLRRERVAGRVQPAGLRARGPLRPEGDHERGRRAQPANPGIGWARLHEPRHRLSLLPSRLDALARAPVFQVRAGARQDPPQARQAAVGPSGAAVSGPRGRGGHAGGGAVATRGSVAGGLCPRDRRRGGASRPRPRGSRRSRSCGPSSRCCTRPTAPASRRVS